MRELVGWAVQPDIGLVGAAAPRRGGPHPARRGRRRRERLRRPPLRGHGTPLRDAARPDRLVPRRALGHRGLRGGRAVGLRRGRGLRRAVRALRQRRRARPRRPVPRAAQRLPGGGRGPAPGVGHPRPVGARLATSTPATGATRSTCGRRPVLLARTWPARPADRSLRPADDAGPLARGRHGARAETSPSSASGPTRRSRSGSRTSAGPTTTRRRRARAARPDLRAGRGRVGINWFFPTSTARSTGGSTPRSASPTTSPATTGSRTASS